MSDPVAIVAGLLGLMVAREYGGYGGTFADLMRVVVEISAGDSNIGQRCQLHTGGIRLLEEFASHEVEREWMPHLAGGEVWMTDAYSDARRQHAVPGVRRRRRRPEVRLRPALA